MEQRTIRGVTIAFDKAGNGSELIVFIHGVGADRTSWKPQLPFFAEQSYTAIAIDMRGSGDSNARQNDGLLAPISRFEFAQDVDGLIKELGFSKAHWIGNSMGGVIILEALSQQLQSLDKVVLCNTFAKHPESIQILPRASQSLSAKSLQQFAAERIPLVLRQDTDPTTLKEAIYAMARKDPESYLASWRATWSPDYRSMLSAITHRTLVVTSTLDTITPPALGEEIAAAIPEAKLISIENAGHISNLDNPDDFNTSILQFLRSH